MRKGLHILVRVSWGKPRQELKADTWRQEQKQKPQRNAACWLAPPGLLSLLSNTTEDHLPRDGSFYIRLGLSVSIFNQKKKMSYRCAYRQSDGSFLMKGSLYQTTLTFVRLAIKGQRMCDYKMGEGKKSVGGTYLSLLWIYVSWRVCAYKCLPTCVSLLICLCTQLCAYIHEYLYVHICIAKLQSLTEPGSPDTQHNENTWCTYPSLY